MVVDDSQVKRQYSATFPQNKGSETKQVDCWQGSDENEHFQPHDYSDDYAWKARKMVVQRAEEQGGVTDTKSKYWHG